MTIDVEALDTYESVWVVRDTKNWTPQSLYLPRTVIDGFGTNWGVLRGATFFTNKPSAESYASIHGGFAVEALQGGN
jgi:hypothetical protein